MKNEVVVRHTLATMQGSICHDRKNRKRKFVDVDLQWSEGHKDITFAGMGVRLLNNQSVACFYVPVSCTKKKYIEAKVNDILDKLEASSRGGDGL